MGMDLVPSSITLEALSVDGVLLLCFWKGCHAGGLEHGVIEVHSLLRHDPATVQESLREQKQQRKVNHAQQTSA